MSNDPHPKKKNFAFTAHLGSVPVAKKNIYLFMSYIGFTNFQIFALPQKYF